MHSTTTQKKRLTLKVILLGESGVGKSSIVNQFVNKKFLNYYKATIGVDFLQKQLTVDGVDVTLHIWDTAGFERYQSLGSAYYRGADCCVLVYDLTSSSSFRAIESWRDEFLVVSNPSDPDDFPFMLLGNKFDLIHDRAVSSSKAENWCRQVVNMKHFEVSAKEDWRLDDAFKEIVRMCLIRLRRGEEEYPDFPERINLHNRNTGQVDDDVTPLCNPCSYS
uniref:Ras-related protein Rab-7b n=1 Tax=Meloidogyne hapla TaxID=6305 RepID=A0A1I8AZ49_MELHA